MMMRDARWKAWLFAVLVGLGTGVAAHIAVPSLRVRQWLHRPQRVDAHYNCCRTDDPLCRGGVLPAASADAAASARSRLEDYGRSLCALANEVEKLAGHEAFKSRDDVLSVMDPLAPFIVGLNNAYVHLSMARVATDLEILSRPDLRDGAQLVCTMREIERFQWDDYRIQINALLVPLLAVWQGTDGADALTRVNEHLTSEGQEGGKWSKLALSLRAEIAKLPPELREKCVRK